MYDKVSTQLNFVEREKEVLDFWKKNDVFQKSIENREGGPSFTFFDGPPTANGKPHIGHIITRVMKDIIPRYKTMKGYHVLRKAGWDTHGLPVELEVEKTLGLDGKPQIESYGIEPFIEKCKESVWKYKSEWERMSETVGYWADMEHPYITYDNNYIESVWWSLKKVHEKGLLYHGHKVVPYCPRCGTALSSHEVAQGYKDVTDPSCFVRFKVKGKENTYLLAWTTTPWTLPSNVALCINKKEDYVTVSYKGEKLIMAAALVPSVLKEDYEILSTYKGQDMVGMEYEPLYSFVVPKKKAYYVVEADYVTLTDGSGIVHTAPAFGEDDAQVGRRYDLPFLQLVDAQGLFVPEAGEFAGMFVKDADAKILEDLDGRGLLFASVPYEHSYPFCWRCDTPLLYYARSTWFIRMTEVKDKLLANNQKINWIPENIKDGRMGNFLENVIDWGLSRERYWGTPLPVWECECGHVTVIGSREELYEKGINVPENIELHKPYIDQVEIVCEKCGRHVKRVPEVIDCWYDSGSMPFAQWHYPFENQEIFKENYPADYISEAIDQTRGWFYTLLAISTLIFDEPAFKNCIVLGHVNDKDGRKMSKHIGNVIDPFTVLDKQGADAVRWYFYTSSAPWLPSRFYPEAVSEAQRKFMGTLWNTYAFYVLYANIDGFDPKDYPDWTPEKLGVMDRWVLSRLSTLVARVGEDLDNYRITEPARAIGEFVDELSNWYVRRGRERYWGNGMTEDKLNAFMTLQEVLVTLSKLIAPFVPFMAESIYQNLVRKVDPEAPVSVHLCDFPKADPALVDGELEEAMDTVLKAVVLGRAARSAGNVKNRQPLATAYIEGAAVDEEFTRLIAEELNVKKVDYIESVAAFTDYAFKPQLRTVGPRYGKLVGRISQELKELDGAKAMAELEKTGRLALTVEDTAVELTKEDLLIESMPKAGFISQQDRGMTVVLDTNLTDELMEEGLVREVISKVQTQRKQAGFEVTDHIVMGYKSDEELAQVLKEREAMIRGEILCDGVEPDLREGFEKAWDINGHELTLWIKKV